MKSEFKMERSRIDFLIQTNNNVMHLDLPHDYDVEVLREIPGGAFEPRYFPRGRSHGCDGLMMRVVPKASNEWIGLFAREPVGNYVTAVCACPEPNHICVIANGENYFVDVRDPAQSVEVISAPVIDIAVSSSLGLVALANFTSIALLDTFGQRWLTERISFDGIRHLRFEANVIKGTAWSPMAKDHEFSLDVSTGIRIS